METENDENEEYLDDEEIDEEEMDESMDEEERKKRALKRLFGMTREELETTNLLDLPREKMLRIMFVDKLFSNIE